MPKNSVTAMTTEDVLELLSGAATSAAVGAAMELGLFWLLDREPLDTEAIAGVLEIPPRRCGYWLQVLVEAGFLERHEGAFRPSASGRAVIGGYSMTTWALLAEEARERLQALRDLPTDLRASGPSDTARAAISGAYSRMASDPVAARRFTRMLYEVHLPLARELAAWIDLRNVSRLMDLGGGSGVVALELVRQHPAVAVTVVDLRTVCAAGAEIVEENGFSGRVSFHAADFLRQPLPVGFDVVLECDVNVYDANLLGQIRQALNPGGRYVIVDHFAASPGDAAPSRAHWALAGSMLDAEYTPPCLPWIRALLAANGFRVANERRLEDASAGKARFAGGLTILDTHPI